VHVRVLVHLVPFVLFPPVVPVAVLVFEMVQESVVVLDLVSLVSVVPFEALVIVLVIVVWRSQMLVSACPIVLAM